MCLQFGLSNAQLERNKTKEQLEEEKKISLSIRIKPLNIENLGTEKLRQKATELWECIIKLETEKYDLEERQKRQDYDVSIIIICAKNKIIPFILAKELKECFFLTVKRAQRKTEATVEAQGPQEGSRP